MFLSVIAFVAVTIYAAPPAPGDREIEFKLVDNPALIAFAAEQFKDVANEVKATGRPILESVSAHMNYAEADLNDDGVPELILNFRDRDAGLCGTAGCSSAIFRRTVGRAKRQVPNTRTWSGSARSA